MSNATVRLHELVQTLTAPLVDAPEDSIPDDGPLHRLQDAIEPLRGRDRHESFVIFFLYNFLDDLFYNVTGDFVYPFSEEADRERGNLFREVARVMNALAGTLQSGTFEECCERLAELVDVYLSGMSNIAEKTTPNPKNV